jgi:hypothetical protein
VNVEGSSPFARSKADSTSALPKSFPDTYHIDVVQYSPTDGVVGGQRMVLKTTVDQTP